MNVSVNKTKQKCDSELSIIFKVIGDGLSKQYQEILHQETNKLKKYNS